MLRADAIDQGDEVPGDDLGEGWIVDVGRDEVDRDTWSQCRRQGVDERGVGFWMPQPAAGLDHVCSRRSTAMGRWSLR